MAVIHAGLTSEIFEQYNVTHRHWQDRLIMYKSGVFRRKSTGCAGDWHLDADGSLQLQWFDWATEIVLPNRDGYQSEVMRMTPVSAVARSDHKRTVVVQLIGGLGNQMFQYAHGLALARQLNAELKLEHLRGGRAFALHHFNLALTNDFPGDIPVIHDESGYTPGLDAKIRKAVEAAMSPVAAVRGYFQNEQFFKAVKDEIRQQFCPPPKLLSEYGDRTPVCVSVRRGDFVNHPLHDVCTPAYFETARKIMSNLVEKPCFVIHSDDLDWCRQLMQSWPDTVFYAPSNLYDAFSVMCSCKAFIISNSTFGWWAAWLSGSDLVIRPDRFLNDRPWDIGPDRWIRIPGDGLGSQRVSSPVIGQSPTPSANSQFDQTNDYANQSRTPRYRVFSYRNGGNLGDTIQTLALSRLLPGPLEGI